MKKKAIQISMIATLLFAGNQLFANTYEISNDLVSVSDSTVETFKVYGNCGMCKKTIEGSLKDVEGIDAASWSSETKVMEVSFDSKVVSLEYIKKKISLVGYDTEEYRATNKSYKSLPGCCQYERPAELKEEKPKENHSGHSH